MWEARAWALRRCRYCRIEAARSRTRCRAAGGRGSDAISAWVAKWTCGSVTSGFFPPQPLGLAGEEQVADLRDQQMSFEGRIAPDLEVRQAQFALLILQAALDGPAAEGDMQHHRQRDSRARVAHEVLHLVAIQHMAGDHQPVRTDHAARAR